MKKTFFALIAIPILFAGGAASAFDQIGDGRMVLKSHTVSTADLALDTPQGRDRLDMRIRVAARLVCGPLIGRPLEEKIAINACFKEAVSRVQPRKAQLIGGHGAALAGHQSGGVVVSAP